MGECRPGVGPGPALELSLMSHSRETKLNIKTH